MPPSGRAEEGVVFPADGAGRRSTIAAGKAVFAAAARAGGDAALADAIMAEPNWRKSYAKHVTKVAETSAASAEAALKVAEAGLAAISSSFEFVRDGKTTTLADAMAAPRATKFRTGKVMGSAPPSRVVEVPHNGRDLSGDALAAQLRTWTEYGCAEPGVESAIASLATGGGVELTGKVFIVLGATSALGPLASLLKWGATVLAVARPKPASWSKLISAARASAGTFLFPVRAAVSDDDAALAAEAGADLIDETPEILAWLQSTLAQLRCTDPVVGMYTYLDSDAHVKVSIASDLIMTALAPAGSKASLAYIQTPSLAYDIPAEAREASVAAYSRAWLSMLGYLPNARPAVAQTSPPRYIHDGMLNLQGPNYALAKTMQMWRSLLARSRDQIAVSSNCAPAARTASMVAGDNKNAGAVAAGLDGMRLFKPMMVFEQVRAMGSGQGQESGFMG